MVSPGFLQQFLESSLILPFLRTEHGGGASPPSCCKLLAKYVCCRAVADVP